MNRLNHELFSVVLDFAGELVKDVREIRASSEGFGVDVRDVQVRHVVGDGRALLNSRALRKARGTSRDEFAIS